MERIQFYPSQELDMLLEADAKKKSVSKVVVVKDILEKYYGLVPANSPTEAELEAKVFEEIADFIATHPAGTTFDLNGASSTYSSIDMVFAGKPSSFKARLGKLFASKMNNGEFKVEQVFLPNGKPKKTTDNRASIYRIL